MAEPLDRHRIELTFDESAWNQAVTDCRRDFDKATGPKQESGVQIMQSSPASIPRVSIIIPCFNVGKHIGETIESVIAQSFGDWELLLVDDGSTDDSAAILQSFAQREPRIKIFSQPNSGVSAARNHGMEFARGDFIALLDADDLWHADFLKLMLQALLARPDWVGVACGTKYFGDRENLVMPSVESEFSIEDLLIGCPWCSVGGALFRNDAARRCGPFNPQLRGGEDWDFWKRMLLQGPFGAVHQPLFYYRRHPSQASRKFLMMARHHLKAAEHFRRKHPEIIERYGPAKYHRQTLEFTFSYAVAAQKHENMLAAAGVYFLVWSRPPFPLWTVKAFFTRWLPQALGARQK